MTEPPKVFAIVSRHDYPRLRRLLPALPERFFEWIERRYGERQAYESASARYAELEAVCPVAFARDCRASGEAPSEAALDRWASRRLQAATPPATVTDRSPAL